MSGQKRTNPAALGSRILVVDDVSIFRDILAAALTTQGHSVEVTGDGSAAEQSIAANSFDLIITDILMPERDGLEMIMNLHLAKSTIPIIAMTGAHGYTELYLKTAKALGATRVLAKPFGLTEFLEATREALSPVG
jgi:CheY-like chemotaxis protein